MNAAVLGVVLPSQVPTIILRLIGTTNAASLNAKNMLWEEKKLHAVVIPKNRDMLIGGDVMTHQKYTTFVSKQHITSSNFCLLFNSTYLFICSFTVRGGIHVRDVLRPSVASHRPTGVIIFTGDETCLCPLNCFKILKG